MTRALITRIVTLVIIISVPPPAAAQAVDGPVDPAEIGHGSLLLLSPDGAALRAPNQATQVTISVRGLVAEAVVTQHFSNPEDEWVEGVYVFPLPVDTAVHAMRLQIGERIIEGQVKERAEAKKTYERAKRQGKKASLVEQERPNIFTTSVANIGPGDEVSVEIRYQEVLEFDSGRFELRFPMVVGPRFMPGAPNPHGPGGTGWAFDTTQVPDASRISPPVLHPSRGPINPVDLTVTLDAGLPVEAVVCRSHDAAVDRMGDTHRVVLTGVPADRDFILEWRPQHGAEPRAAVFTEERDGAFYVLAMLMPPVGDDAAELRLARETVFVIDTSGSMGGTSIIQARRAVDLALERLQPDDWFNVIAFSGGYRQLFPASRQALPPAVDEARSWVERLSAGGGTNMMPALRAALVDPEEHTPLRQVVFITDGCVGNEDALFAEISSSLGRSRLFTVGIGSAPNAHFMERAARFGRGSSTTISSPIEVAARMGELFAKIEQPVLADVELVFPDPDAEVWPERIPDLYHGEPVLVTARLGTIHGDLRATGTRSGGSWEREVGFEVGTTRAGVHRLWARRKIASLMDRRTTGTPEAEVRAAVLEVALGHSLVSKYTSLVAVDVTPTRPVDEGLATRPVPTNLPAGWDFSRVFGSMPRGGTAARLHLIVGLLGLALACAVRVLKGVQ
jgi:Ca-activated chloride channel family protein